LENKSYVGRIVVAEDDRFYRQILAKRLRAEGHDVVLTSNGEEAWERILDDPPELLLTDWMMPKLDGFGLCRRVKADLSRKTIYCLLLTAKDRVEDKVAALDAGADDYLLKPCDDGELLARVRAGLRAHRMCVRLATASRTDPLTGVGNRRLFDERIQEEWMRSRRYGAPLSVLLLDLDGFKAINDRWGHPAGDTVLARIGELLRTELRSGECAARIGGDEFAAILPNTDHDGARTVADRVERRIAALKIDVGGEFLPILGSAGTAQLGPLDDALALIAAADSALYRRKQIRNRTTVESA